MKLKKLLSLSLAVVMSLSLAVPAMAEEETTKSDDVVVFYTNDVHTYINNTAKVKNDKDEEVKVPALRYSTVAALKAANPGALLVDAGDHVQGTAYGSMDKGATIVKLMNAASYDLATLGNHEFDYGMERCLETVKDAQFPHVSCNFYHEKKGKAGDSVLDAYKVLDANGTKIAFVGITTPESFTKSTPAYFQNDKGEYIYGIAGGTDGKALYDAVQKAIDEVTKKEKPDYVIALGHLGVDDASKPWTSKDLIANTTGLDAFIDGHSHSVVEMEKVADKKGNEVVLTQTGSYLGAIGKLTITADGITTQLLGMEDVAELTPDAKVKEIEDAWAAEIDKQLGEVIGSIDDTLDNYDADGNRLVRKQETNTGDFAADALYYLFDNMDLDVDVAIMNGGGIRNKAITGDISYLTCKDIHTFGNVACLQTITGQQLLDALEWGAKDAVADGSKENGGFLHVSGTEYTIDLSVPSTVQKDDKNVWTGGPTGEYRVKDVKIRNSETGEMEPLDLAAKYNLAGYNYTLRDLGDGFAMFDGAVNVLDYVSEDYMVLANYVKSFENGKVVGYAQPAGRITILGLDDAKTDGDANLPGNNTKPVDQGNVVAIPTDAEAESYVTGKGWMTGTDKGFDPEMTITRAQVYEMLWKMEGKNVVNFAMDYTDIPENIWYAESARWATSEKLTNGVGDGLYAGDTDMTRQEVFTVLYRYMKERLGKDVSAGAEYSLEVFEDYGQVQAWAVDAAKWAWISGVACQEDTDPTLDPTQPVTRVELAKMLTVMGGLMG